MAKILIFLIITLPFAFCPNVSAIYDIPKLVVFFSCSYLLFLSLINEKTIKFNTISFLVLLYLFINIISTIFSISPLLSIIGIYRRYDGMNTLLCYVILFFVCLKIEKPKPILYAIVISATISSLYAISQHFGFYIIPSLTKDRTISLFGNPNFLAAYLLMSIPIILSFYFQKKNILFLIVFIIILIGLLLTKTRATFIGLFLQLIFLFLFLRPKKRELLIILIILITAIPFSIPIIKRIKDAGKDIARIGLYKGSYNVFLAYPLFGTGPECLHFAFIKRLPEEFIKEYKGKYIFADKSHNEFLDILATRGLIAFILWILILGFIFKVAIYSKERQYTIPLASSILGYLCQAQFNLSFFPISHLLWIMMGLIGGRKKGKVVVIKRYPKFISFLSLILGFLLFFHICSFYLADVYFHKACVFERSGYKKETIFYYKKASSINKWETEYRRKEIEFLLNLGENKEACEKIRKALVFASYEARFWFLLARAKEREKSSIIYYKKAISLSPYWADPYNNLAIVYALNKDYSLAEKYFLHSANLCPDYKENLKNLYKEQIQSFLNKRKLEGAKAIVLKLLKIDPQDSYGKEVLNYILNTN